MSKLYDFLFELTEYSENEGEQILCEEETLEEAYRTLAHYGFNREELRYIDKLETWYGEMLGLDTY